jgi:hypothetical protein
MTNQIRTTVQKFRTQVLAHGQEFFESAINCEFLRGMDDYGNRLKNAPVVNSFLEKLLCFFSTGSQN